eukprot:COSAG02_NODE_12387_length_1555_cov_1.443681_2_plen_35_part_01
MKSTITKGILELGLALVALILYCAERSGAFDECIP